MIRAHRSAVLDLLDVPNLTVHDGLVPNLPVLPYVVLWMTGPRRVTHSLCGVQSDADLTFATTCVGSDAEQVEWAQEKVHAALVDSRITVAGRSVTRIQHEDSAMPDVDYDVDPPVVTSVDVWRLLSVPA